VVIDVLWPDDVLPPGGVPNDASLVLRITMGDVSFLLAGDIEAAADFMRPMLALYVGGMGARGANFHYDVIARLGYEGECAQIQDLYLQGKKKEAMAAVPTKMVQDLALIGPLGKIKDELPAWKNTVLTTMHVNAPTPQMLTTIADLVLS
jgi:hypothetical protein